jgi:integrase
MMAEYKKLMDIRQHGEKPEITLHDAFQLCVDSVKNKAPSTHTSYQLSMNKLLGLKPDFKNRWTLDGARFLSDLTDDDLQDHLQSRLDEGLTQNTINVEVRFLKQAWNLCRKRYKANDDLTFVLPKGFVKCRSLSISEEERVIAHCCAKQTEFEDAAAWSKAHDLFIYLIDTGVRLNEATQVEWTSIELSEGYIDNYNFKTKKEVFVPISNRLRVVLLNRLDQPQPFMQMDRAVKNLRKAITECCPSSPRILVTQGKATIHSCRDTYATRMLNDGMRLEKVSHLLGHSTVVQTQKYAKFSKKDLADKARAVLNQGREE